jgi:hypothetical protein
MPLIIKSNCIFRVKCTTCLLKPQTWNQSSMVISFDALSMEMARFRLKLFISRGNVVTPLQMQKYKDREEEVKKKGLSVLPGESARARTTPSSTLPWSAKRVQEFTLYEICIWLHHRYLPVVIARPYSALPTCDYATIG